MPGESVLMTNNALGEEPFCICNSRELLQANSWKNNLYKILNKSKGLPRDPKDSTQLLLAHQNPPLWILSNLLPWQFLHYQTIVYAARSCNVGMSYSAAFLFPSPPHLPTVDSAVLFCAYSAIQRTILKRLNTFLKY